MTTFKDEIKAHFMDEEGLVTKVRNPGHWSTGNGLLFTGLFYSLLGVRGELEPSDKDHFEKAVEACFVNRVTPVLNRNKGRPDFEGWDDYNGVVAAAFFVGSDIAKDILNYGEANCFNFNNEQPKKFTLRSWFGRLPGFPGHLRLCGKSSPGNLQTLCLLHEFQKGCKNESDPDANTWLRVEVARRASSRFNESIAAWDKSLKKVYGSLGRMFEPSFGSDHPFVIYNL
jgi:hypothetical protein